MPASISRGCHGGEGAAFPLEAQASSLGSGHSRSAVGLRREAPGTAAWLTLPHSLSSPSGCLVSGLPLQVTCGLNAT